MGKNIGKIIKKLRKKRGWGQKELADKIEASVNAISFWENNQRFPRPEQLQKICKIFDISEAELFGAPSPGNITPEIKEALEDPVAVKALLITHKSTNDIKAGIQKYLEHFPNMPEEKRNALLALLILCK